MSKNTDAVFQAALATYTKAEDKSAALRRVWDSAYELGRAEAGVKIKPRDGGSSKRVAEEEVESYSEARERATASPIPTLKFSVRGDVLQRNQHVLIKGRPVKIVDLSSSSAGYGKKLHIVGIDIFTSKRLEDISWTTHFFEAPLLARHEYTLVNIDTPILNLLTDDGTTKDDVNLPSTPLGISLEADFLAGKELRVTTLRAMNEEQVMSYKEFGD
ncbi:eukaryotic elongation factor 5A hypusine, DNA-binding OB fold-domain-containing protein [Mycena crocata]|nr:eukaryotic elongation factor 5A hypusine, DNA-binding OB fold-domain-containing protein [Mycena crocata]